MKLFMLPILLLILNINTAIAQGIGGSGSTGGGLMTMRHIRAAAMQGKCAEGNVTGVEVSKGAVRYMEYRTCTNGTYMTAEEQAAYIRVPRRISCKEGARYLDTYYNDPSDRTVYYSKVCIKGRWVTERTY